MDSPEMGSPEKGINLWIFRTLKTGTIRWYHDDTRIKSWHMCPTQKMFIHSSEGSVVSLCLARRKPDKHAASTGQQNGGYRTTWPSEIPVCCTCWYSTQRACYCLKPDVGWSVLTLWLDWSILATFLATRDMRWYEPQGLSHHGRCFFLFQRVMGGSQISIGRWCCVFFISGEAKRHAPGVGRGGEGGRVDRKKKTPKMMVRGCI